MSAVNLINLTKRSLKVTCFVLFKILSHEDFLSAQLVLQGITFKLKGHRMSLLCLLTNNIILKYIFCLKSNRFKTFSS